MQIDIRTDGITPLRQTFANIARRIGPDKPATRYQEAMYDLQPDTSFHYRPLWQPEYELYDSRRTAVKMADWHALKDPRQFYYGTWVNNRARQQESMEKNLEFIEQRGLLAVMPAATRDILVTTLVVLRHAEWAANMNNAYVTAYGYGSAITEAAMFQTMDRLALAQYLTRIGLLIGGKPAVDTARTAWLDDPAWQGVRHATEDLLVRQDWFELFVAQNLVFDGLVYPLFYQKLDAQLAIGHGPTYGLATDFMRTWFGETSRWVDAVVKTAAQESAANAAVLGSFAFGWLDRFEAALEPVAQRLFGDDGGDVLAAVAAPLEQRLAGLGLTRQGAPS
ncbi:aromatic/alkene monooxygenase hydroxylase subunit beta [Massilia terrae]|uniref:Aromatic/alkene monooxygenase hydroxylase subunit beta n=1 Tax=Massilia terrae TaxID=1811224 RepID=A0ABT2CT97_9BURK|nr:aromatic/alkene monooxygenase hydroxylase subunit beta [Massilia terrae]MCS0657191.1 aromatic/alkene monooxygenase hydroxylase subunit beta [Massilia terrae]